MASGVGGASPRELVSEVLAGRTRGIARMMSRAEAGGEASRAAMAEIYLHTGRAHVVGLTGAPGGGKSTLARSLARLYREGGRKIGIIAIDPTSPFSGGAILGDRVRMADLAEDPGVFIRSMATRGALGGLARASLDAVDILDAAGFDVVLVETVGVGQDEVEIVQVAHTVAVVSPPGLGDEIQAIKAGILEIADIHAVSKCDRPDSARTISDLKGMLALGVSAGPAPAWEVPVVATSCEKNEGIDDLLSAIDGHLSHLQESDGMDRRRRRIIEMRVRKTAEDIVRGRFAGRSEGRLAELLERVMAREMDPYSAAVDLLADFHEEGGHD
ncbi:MAG: methylmalonyl Co-A mutase-associated GTPase MeaB [bacterium]